MLSIFRTFKWFNPTDFKWFTAAVYLGSRLPFLHSWRKSSWRIWYDLFLWFSVLVLSYVKLSFVKLQEKNRSLAEARSILISANTHLHSNTESLIVSKVINAFSTADAAIN